MYFEVIGNPYEGTLQIGDPITNKIVDYSDYDTRRRDDAVKEFILSAVRDYLGDMTEGFGRSESDSPI